MNDDLDRLIERLRAQPLPDRLNRVEGDVLRRIRAARPTPAVVPVWRAAAVGLALAAGLGVGGAATAVGSQTAPSASGLMDASKLAPSSLLGGGE